MFLSNFHIFINKRALPQQRFPVQVTTLPDCDDITRFDGSIRTVPPHPCAEFVGQFVRVRRLLRVGFPLQGNVSGIVA